MNSKFKQRVMLVSLLIAPHIATAGSATWSFNPVSNDWNLADNWTPQTVPNTETDSATFGSSNVTSLMIGEWTDGSDNTLTRVGSVIFNEGASGYTITVTPVYNVVFATILTFNGEGIINNSGIAQNFVTAHSGTTKASGEIYFEGAASAGENVVITNEGGDSMTGDGYDGGFTVFGYNTGDTASAGKATIINQGGLLDGTLGGACEIVEEAGAESASIINDAGEVAGAGSGWTLVRTDGNIGNSTFIGNAASVTGAEGGWAEFDVGTAEGANFIANGAATAGPQAGQIYVYGWGAEGYATFTGNGGSGSGAEGGLIDVFGLPLLSAQTIVIAKSGTNGGLGGTILLEEDAVVNQPQFQVSGNAVLDLSAVTVTVMAIGSLAGSGQVLLDGHSLSVGNNNLSTTFSGSIQQAGTLIKDGSGTFTLTGANTQNGGTTVNAGVLIASNRNGSATGTGKVNVKAGTLGGKGIISGAVTMGTGAGSGAVLAPGIASNQLATLTLKKTVTFKADSTYTYKLNTNNARADQVIAKGVTIESGAQFSLVAVANKKLTNGTVFTAINNTSANPISGTFSNLADNSTFTSGRNKYQVSYEGGTGNDLTLTVVP